MTIGALARLEPGRIFYSGKLYIVESTGSVSKARPWGAPPGATKDCLTLSPKSTLARFYPVLERALILPILARNDFLKSNQPTAYVFETEKIAHRAALLDLDLAMRCGLSLQHLYRTAAWLLTDGANPHRLYHYNASAAAETAFANYSAKQGFVQCKWPDDRTQHWTLLTGYPFVGG